MPESTAPRPRRPDPVGQLLTIVTLASLTYAIIEGPLAQGLTGISTQLRAAEEEGQAAGRERHLDAAIRLARDSLSEARRSVHELRPEPLEQARLGEALEDPPGVPADLNHLRAAGQRLPRPGRTDRGRSGRSA